MKTHWARLIMCAMTLAGALFVGGMLSRVVGAALWLPPLAVVGVLAWLPAFPPAGRIWIAGSAGCVIDALSDTAFGAHILVFLAASFAVDSLRALVSGERSLLWRIATTAALAASVLLALPFAGSAAAFMHGLFS